MNQEIKWVSIPLETEQHKRLYLTAKMQNKTMRQVIKGFIKRYIEENIGELEKFVEKVINV